MNPYLFLIICLGGGKKKMRKEKIVTTDKPASISRPQRLYWLKMFQVYLRSTVKYLWVTDNKNKFMRIQAINWDIEGQELREILNNYLENWIHPRQEILQYTSNNI